MDKDLMILEAMNNQYLIAEHYYDLTEYIDKNIYKFRRNGKYLQEGFGTVALWIAGIALAAGIGWWVYKKFFDKSSDKKKEEQIKKDEQQMISNENERKDVIAEINNNNPNLPYKMESMNDFIMSDTYKTTVERMLANIKQAKDNNNLKVWESLIDIYAEELAKKYGYTDIEAVKNSLGLEELKQAKLSQAKGFIEDILNKIKDVVSKVSEPVKKVLNTKAFQTFGKIIGTIVTVGLEVVIGAGVVFGIIFAITHPMAFLVLCPTIDWSVIVSISGGIFLTVWIGKTLADAIKELNETQAFNNDNYQNSLKESLYILNYFNAINIVLTNEKNLNPALTPSTN